jgi:hypothetical protein
MNQNKPVSKLFSPKSSGIFRLRKRKLQLLPFLDEEAKERQKVELSLT